MVCPQSSLLFIGAATAVVAAENCLLQVFIIAGDVVTAAVDPAVAVVVAVTVRS